MLRRPVVVIGVDPGSHLLAVVVTIDGKDVQAYKRPLPQRNIPHQLYVLRRWFYRLVRQYVVDGCDVHVFVEEPFVSPKTVRAALPLARVNGILLEAAFSAGAVTVERVIIQAWKKSTVGKGNASKPAVKAWAKKYWPALFELANGVQDVYDAGGVNRHGQKFVERMKNNDPLED